MFTSAIVQGSSHVKCDDYAIDFNSGVVICDGCSGSKYSDIGSRIICALTSELITRGITKTPILPEFIVDELLTRIPQLLRSRHLGILDTTILLLNFTTDDKSGIRYTMLGDGHVYIKYRNGNRIHSSIQYSGNAPLYPSYLYYSDLMEKFLEMNQKKIVSTFVLSPESIFPEKWESIESNNIVESAWYHSDIIDQIAIFTDGIDTFDCDKQPWEIAEELTDFKVLSYGVAQRRLNAVVKKYGHPSDDFSMGVWINETDEN